jgi:mannose-6-phosphate isomerase-like protein (cupin superfamily)
VSTVIRFGEQEPFGEGDLPLVMRRLLDAERHTDALSITWVSIWGRHERLRTDASDRAYFLVTGTARFQVGDGPWEEVAAGDVVLVRRGQPYELEGTCTYLVINAPAFRPGDDVY